MTTTGVDAVDLALACYRAPLAHQERFAASAPLPAGMDRLLKLASGSPALLDYVARRTGAPLDQLREAARFLVQQLCFARGACHYRVLGLEPGAPLAQIKEHHRRLISLYHPDHAIGCERWTEGYAARINEAWTVLSRPESRARYDAQLQRPEPRGPLSAGRGSSRRRASVPIGRRAYPTAILLRPRRPVGRRLRSPGALVGLVLVGALLVGAICSIVPTSTPLLYAPSVASSTQRVDERPWVNEQAFGPVEGVRVRDVRFRIEQQAGAEQRSPRAMSAERTLAYLAQPPAGGPREQTRPTPDPFARTAPVLPSSTSADVDAPPGHPLAEATLTVEDIVELFEGYASAFRNADLDGLMALFAAGAQGSGSRGREGIRRDYSVLFGTFAIRRLKLFDLHWELRGDCASAVARYEQWLLGRDTGELSQTTGIIRFDLRKRDGVTRIESVDRPWSAY